MKNWFDDDDFWQIYGPLMFDDGTLAFTETEIERFTQLSGISSESLILDTCCGPGRHSLKLAEKGYRLTGVDLCRPYLDSAAAEARKKGLEVEWIHSDIRQFKRSNHFNAAINLFNSIGYFLDEEEDLLFFRNVYDSLTEKGIFFIEVTGKEVWARNFTPRIWFERDDVKIFIEYSVDLNWTELEHRWLFYKEGNMTERRFRFTLYSAREIAGLLSQAGFHEIDFYGGYDGRAYGPDAETMIVIAKK